jgi:hypothetical protein
MARGRPGSYTTFAVMNFIVGGFALLCGVCSGINWDVTVNGRNVTPEMVAFLNQEVPGYSAIRIAGMVVEILLGLGLIASGVGLLQVAQWGRILAILLSALTVLHHIGMAVFQLFLVNPALDRYFARFFPFNFSFMVQSGAWVTVSWHGLILVYCIVQILVLSFQPPTRARAYEEEEGDWEDRRRPARRPRDRYEDEYDEQPRRRRRRDPDEYDDR